MSNLFYLVKGELFRLVKYKTIFFGVLASLLWVAIISFQSIEEAKQIIPLLVITDSGMMSVILMGANFYFEKQENTIQSLLVSPVSLTQVLIAKIIAAMSIALISLVIVGGAAMIIHSVSFQIVKLLLAMVVVVTSHTAIGYIVIFRSKDFLTMLIKFAGIILLFYVPAILFLLNILTEEWELLAFLSPSYAGEYLIRSAFAETKIGYQMIGFIYLTALGIGLYQFYVFQQFRKVSIEGK